MFKKMGKSVRMNMLVGLFLIIPVVATVLIIKFLFTFITDYLVPQQWLQTDLGPIYRLIALVIVVLGLYFIGLLARNIIGKSMYRMGDYVLARIPLIKSIYISIRQISESLVSSRSSLFKQVVAIEYPRRGVYAIAFLTSALPSGFMPGVQDASGDPEFVSLFLPTSPNPTSGFLLMVPRSEIVPLKMDVAEGMKMVMSAGAVLPGESDRAVPTLLDRVEEWFKQGN
ncbi:DUF502 domain-containing protein [Verrucomicrobiota bacterium]